MIKWFVSSRQDRKPLVQMPEVPADLRAGIDKTLKDNAVDDEELAKELLKVWTGCYAPTINQCSLAFSIHNRSFTHIMQSMQEYVLQVF